MTMVTIKLKPGVDVERTPTLLEAGYALSNLIRFRAGLAEKLGGWVKFYNFVLSGVPKCLHAWQDTNEIDRLGIGATTLLGYIENGALGNITPQTLTSNIAPNFSTTISSTTVIVADSNIANITNFDAVEFKTPVSVGGLILSGSYAIDAALSATTYRIIAAVAATATVNNVGAVPVFGSVATSSLVNVTLPNHDLSVGGNINFPIPTTLGGVTISGTYSVISVTSADVFVISATNAATGSTTLAMNSTLARLLYYIAIGPAQAYSGYSVGPYSAGTYSTGATSSAQTGTPITATDWTLDNWGSDLLACPHGGALYYWEPNAGFTTARPIIGNGAPIFNTGMFVSMQTQMLIAYGSCEAVDIGIDTDPLLVKWSAQGDFLDWAITLTSQAGSRRLSTGSKIVSGLSVQNQELLWTDLDLWSMSYLGYPEAWGFLRIGANCGLIGKHAVTKQGANVYWMGPSNFFAFGGGGVQVVPCTVWDTVFQDLNETYQSKCWAWSNTPFNEIWFFYPRASTSATECDAYVKFNTGTGEWDYGADSVIDRSAGIDQSLLGKPIAASPTGLIYQHEEGYDADGVPLNPVIETGWFALTEGHDVIFSDWILYDMKFAPFNSSSQSAQIQVTFYTVMYPNQVDTSAMRTYGPYTFTSATLYKNIRLRGRLAKIRLESSDAGSFWRLGGPRLRMAPSGTR